MPVRLRLRAPLKAYRPYIDRTMQNDADNLIRGNGDPMKLFSRLFFSLVAIWGSINALAVCSFDIDVGDGLTFSTNEMKVTQDCEEITVKLKHTGNLGKAVMGHNWVLTRAADVSDVAQKGIAAGLNNNYLPTNDKRILAATIIIGSGEETNISFSSDILSPTENYIFFCSFPGHSFVMKGTLSIL